MLRPSLIHEASAQEGYDEILKICITFSLGFNVDGMWF